MSTKGVQEGKVIVYQNSGSAISSGDIVKIGNRIGVAEVDIEATDGSGSVEMEGVHNLPKTTGQAWSQGDELFYDSTAGKLTKTGSGNTPAGYAFEPAASGDTEGKCKLGECASQSAEVADLNQDISATYVEAEVQAISDKVDEILAALKASGLMDD